MQAALLGLSSHLLVLARYSGQCRQRLTWHLGYDGEDHRVFSLIKPKVAGWTDIAKLVLLKELPPAMERLSQLPGGISVMHFISGSTDDLCTWSRDVEGRDW